MSLQIFLPFYGDPALLKIAVRSVLAQDCPDWELTVVDDHSPGDSVQPWLAELGDDRVRYLRNEVNLGVSGNFDHCLRLADGDLVTFLGGDDELLPSYVRTVLAVRRDHPDAALIQPAVELIDEHGQPSMSLADRVKLRLLRPRTEGSGVKVLDGETLAASLMHGNWLYFPALAFDRVRAQRFGFREDLKTIQDLDLILRMVMDGGKLVVTDELCFRYRRHAASESSWRALAGGRFEEDRAFFGQAAEATNALGWKRAARAARWRITSRLHAATMVPGAVVRAFGSRDRQGLRSLLRHVVR